MTRARSILDRIAAEIDDSGFRAHGVHVLAGTDTVERRWTDDVREEVHSVAKAICVIAAGMAADEGLIDLDAPVAAVLPDFELGPGVETVTVRHLLSMSSGIDLPWSPTLMTDWPDLAREFLARPTSGRTFQYSNASTYTAMRALGAVVGDVAEWLEPRLFAPLGLHGVPWQRCPRGWITGGDGVALRTTELARIGRLIRDRGEWRGRRLISSGWVDAMHTGWVAAGSRAGYERYALSGWDGPGDAWRLHGAHGQLVIFLGDAVVTVTADDHFEADRVAAFAVDVMGDHTRA